MLQKNMDLVVQMHPKIVICCHQSKALEQNSSLPKNVFAQKASTRNLSSHTIFDLWWQEWMGSGQSLINSSTNKLLHTDAAAATGQLDVSFSHSPSPSHPSQTPSHQLLTFTTASHQFDSFSHKWNSSHQPTRSYYVVGLLHTELLHISQTSPSSWLYYEC